MNKKIMILCASPNKSGNTIQAARWVAQGARAKGAKVELIDIAHLKYKVNGCIACMRCQKSKEFKCVIKDEASPVIARIPENDILIFATPLYFFGPTAQLKLFIDRMYSLFKFNYQTGNISHMLKHMEFALISTAGGDRFSALADTFDIFGGFLAAKFKKLLIPFAGGPGDLKKNKQAYKKSLAFGRSLVKG